MDNQENIPQTNQQISENKGNRQVWYLLIIILVLAVASVFLYRGLKNKPTINEGPAYSVFVNDENLPLYFENKDKKLSPDVLPPEEFKTRFEADLVTARQYIIDEEAKEAGNEYQGYMGVANILRSLGQYEEAEQAYFDMIEKFPDDELIYHNLGVLYEDMHQYLEAAKAYSTSIAKKPEELIAYMKLADLYVKYSSQPDKAKEVYLKALEATNNNPEILKAFASYLETVEKNLPEALLYWQEVLKANPDNQAVKERVEELENKTN